jgi:hypothetical protein
MRHLSMLVSKPSDMCWRQRQMLSLCKITHYGSQWCLGAVRILFFGFETLDNTAKWHMGA